MRLFGGASLQMLILHDIGTADGEELMISRFVSKFISDNWAIACLERHLPLK